MFAGPREERVTRGALNLPLLLGGNVSGRTTLWIVGQGRTNNETFEEKSCSKYLVYLFTGEIDVLKDMGGRFSRTKVGNSGCSGVIIVFTVNSDMFSLQLFQNLKNLMNPYRVAFESPLELSAQGNLFPEQKCTHTHTLLTSLPPSGGIFIKKQF